MPQLLKSLVIDVPDELGTQIDALADQTGRSRSLIVNDALESYVGNQLRWLAEMRTAADGVAHSPSFEGEDVLTWLESWGTETEKARPEPTKL